MKSARMIYRYLTAVVIADVLVQFFPAGPGAFSAGGGRAARESGPLDPHRANGMAVTLLALLMLVAAPVAGNSRWRWALPLFLLTLLKPVLAIAGAAGGPHVLNAAAILGTGGALAFHAWRRDGRQRSAPAPATEPAASRSGRA